MKNKDIKKTLRQEADLIVPDLKDKLNFMLDECYSPYTSIPDKKKVTRSGVQLVLAFAIVLFAFVPIIRGYLSSPLPISSNQSTDSQAVVNNTYISIDINPAIELEVDKDQKVVSIRPLNKDAMLLLFDYNFNDLSLEQVIIEIVTLAVEVGYIDFTLDDNALMITTINNDEEIETAIAGIAEVAVNTYLQENELKDKVNVLTSSNNEFKNEAKELGISIGKYQLIYKACHAQKDLSFEQAKKMSVKKLNEIINNLKQEEIDEFRDSLINKFKDLEDSFNQARDNHIDQINRFDDVHKDVNKVRSIEEFNELKLRINDLITTYELDWDFDYGDDFSRLTLNEIKFKLGFYRLQTKHDLNELERQYNYQKNERKREENRD